MIIGEASGTFDNEYEKDIIFRPIIFSSTPIFTLQYGYLCKMFEHLHDIVVENALDLKKFVLDKNLIKPIRALPDGVYYKDKIEFALNGSLINASHFGWNFDGFLSKIAVIDDEKIVQFYLDRSKKLSMFIKDFKFSQRFNYIEFNEKHKTLFTELQKKHRIIKLSLG